MFARLCTCTAVHIHQTLSFPHPPTHTLVMHTISPTPFYAPSLVQHVQARIHSSPLLYVWTHTCTPMQFTIIHMSPHLHHHPYGDSHPTCMQSPTSTHHHPHSHIPPEPHTPFPSCHTHASIALLFVLFSCFVFYFNFIYLFLCICHLEYYFKFVHARKRHLSPSETPGAGRITKVDSTDVHTHRADKIVIDDFGDDDMQPHVCIS